jgi:hypothetical protein
MYVHMWYELQFGYFWSTDVVSVIWSTYVAPIQNVFSSPIILCSGDQP